MRALSLLLVGALVGLAQPAAATALAPRWPQPIAVDVADPGGHALKVLYFENKNTSTLILEWRPPGASGFDVVPANSLEHLGTN